mmetsp:Transcript_13670/g.27673  ORF Transcript_13670/g.27673 Transcript_13670/m.27673 type:complete len:105 (+) Transcript_13670:59-373(+)
MLQSAKKGACSSISPAGPYLKGFRIQKENDANKKIVVTQPPLHKKKNNGKERPEVNTQSLAGVPLRTRGVERVKFYGSTIPFGRDVFPYEGGSRGLAIWPSNGF